MSENIANALKSIKDFTTETNNDKREVHAVVVVNSLLNDLEGTGAYNVLASAVSGFTAVQQHPWKALAAIIQGCLMGWDTLAAHQAELTARQEAEAQQAVKH